MYYMECAGIRSDYLSFRSCSGPFFPRSPGLLPGPVWSGLARRPGLNLMDKRLAGTIKFLSLARSLARRRRRRTTQCDSSRLFPHSLSFFFFSFENSRFSLLPAEVTSPLSSQLSSGHVCFFPRPSAFMSRLLWSSFRATGYDFLHAPEHLLWWNSTVQVQFGTVQYNSPAGKGDGGVGGCQCVLIPSN
jgi:hypothetical protein